ncbi:hypothetical protein GCM10011410_24470 [Hoyosella rhizosphaerae]|uniref:Suppressor of fused-like domain-containing protein n=1 Tax=Hoyosella rhizosphaerae TaxID=1755582 RepID=A0A916XGS2_9ACTN|nr:hypothetical protein GCM10011410_24470 [Hoyosella rhizosphaerae]
MPSPNIAKEVRAHVTETLGCGEPAAASVTFLGVDPMEVLRYGPSESRMVHYVTCGCSTNPMGDPSDMLADPVQGPRAELVLAVKGGADTVLRSLATIAAAPSVEGLVLRADALIDLGEPLWPGAAFTAVLLSPSVIPSLQLPEPYSPVDFFDAAPITATEAAWMRIKGADALREAWAEAKIDTTDPGRSAVRTV